MVQTAGLTHIQILVADLERSLRFYREVFGLTEQFRQGDLVFLSTPGTRDLITLHLNRDANEARRIGRMGGINHFGFRLLDKSNLDEAATA